MLKTGSNRWALGHRFYFFWAGESLAQLGAALMAFALGVWVYRHTGSVVAFSNTVIAATLPSVLILPVAGGLADRINKKIIIVTADLTLACLTLTLLLLLWSNRLQPIHLYIFNGCASVVGAFRTPSYQASINSILAKDTLTRASGLIGMSKNVSALLAPLLGGVLMGSFGLEAVFVINFAACCLGTLFVLKALYYLGAVAADSGHSGSSLLRGVLKNIADALQFFKAEPLMLGLLGYAMIQSSLISLASLMMTPLVLASHTSQQLGLVYTSAALGGLAGVSLLVATTNPRRLILLIVSADAILSLCVLSIGIVTSTALYCALAFLAIAAASLAEGCCNALWMRKIPKRHKASVFALISMLMIATMAVVILAGGFIADKLLEPALATGGMLAHSVGNWLGTGKGRGIALLFVICGALSTLLCLCTFAYPGMRRIDLLVPDEST